jgi:hypothetical protein
MTNTQETVNSILIDVLKGVKDAGSEMYATSKVGLAKAVDFAMEQAPIVVQEFISWKMGDAIFNCIFYSIGVIILLGAIIWLKKKLEKLESYEPEVVIYSLTLVLCIGLAVASMIPIKDNIETIIKIKLAPRVYILEYVTKK